MALKSKFERIDQSKLKQGARDVLAKMKEKSENFTNAEVNKKIEPAIDKLIERLKKENPDALKKASATRTRKPKATAKKKATKKAPAKTSGAKRETVMTVAKRIRKDGEKWQDALKRAKSEMGKDTKKKVSAVKTEVDKLKKLIEKDAVLKGFSNSELQRDAVRKAKPRGKRKTTTKGETTNQYGTYKNKVGRTYWESRENRSDRYAPKYPKNKPFLEMGGDITDAQDLSMANSDFLVMAKGGEIDGRYKVLLEKRDNSGKLYPPNLYWKGNDKNLIAEKVKEAKKDFPARKVFVTDEVGDREIYNFAKGGEIDAFTMSMVKGVDDGVSEIETKDLKARMEKGGLITNQNEKNLMQVLIGLGMKSKSIYDENKPYFDEEDRELLRKMYDRLDKEQYAKGGSVEFETRKKFKLTPIGDIAFVFDSKSRRKGKRILVSNVDIIQSNRHKISEADNKRLMKAMRKKGSDLLTDGTRFYTTFGTDIGEIKHPQFEKELELDRELGEIDFEKGGITIYAKGGRLKSALMRDRKYYNKNESWERAYNKGKSRRGYKEDGGTIENSIQSYQNHYKGFPSYEDGGTITHSTQHFRIMETDTPIYKEGGQIDMDL